MDDLSPAGRQAVIKAIVIKHDRYRETIEGLRTFHHPVKGGLHSTGCLSALIGDARTGKSFATDRYVKQHPPSLGERGKIIPVVYADMPIEGVGGPRAILEHLAEALDMPPPTKTNNPTLVNRVLQTIVDRQVEHIFLDEWDQVFREGGKSLMGFGRGLIRKILNLNTVSVTCIGLTATYDLLRKDGQLTGRGGLPYIALKPYDWRNGEEQTSFRLLCDEFDRALPFNQRSGLGAVEFAERLHWTSDGNIGRLRMMIEAAAALAINEGSDRIETSHFAEAYEVRKPPKTSFNPFIDSISKAPKPAPAGPPKAREPSVSDMFSKARDHGPEGLNGASA